MLLMLRRVSSSGLLSMRTIYHLTTASFRVCCSFAFKYSIYGTFSLSNKLLKEDALESQSLKGEEKGLACLITHPS